MTSRQINMDPVTLGRIVDDVVKAERDRCVALIEAQIESLEEDPDNPETHEWVIHARTYGRIWMRGLLRDVRARGNPTPTQTDAGTEPG